MHPCPCCGYKTLPERLGYDLCPVCWWEDEGLEPWEYSEPNNQTLAEAQQEYLSERRPYRLRPGKVRAPKRKDARDPVWRPYELTDEQLHRVEQESLERQRVWDGEGRRVAQEIADDPEVPFKEYNAAKRLLEVETPSLSHSEIKAKLRDLHRAHGFPDAHLELLSRVMEDENFYRRHPVHAAWWLLRYSRPSTLRQRWTEVRTGTFHFAG
jgi:Cysteine-rich CPCC